MPKNIGLYNNNLSVPRKQDVDAVQNELDQLTIDVDTHIGDTNNPHSVTKAQVGLGNVANVLQYSVSNPPPYPVTSVNGNTGAVSLTASSVGAVPTSRTVNGKALSSNITLTANDVGADASGAAAAAQSAAISSANNYTDTQLAAQIPDVSNFVTAQDPTGIVNTVPPTFDGHTTDDFVLKTDVINTLTSSEIQSPLSANQGRILNESILANTSNITNLLTEIDNKVDINGATMMGILVAQSNTNYSVGQVRNFYLSTSEPTANIGNDGDIWIVYEV